MKIAVLGKGISLNNFTELPNTDEYVIVNDFDQEVLQNTFLRSNLIEKPVTHVANRHRLSMDTMVSNHMYDTLNIIQHVQPYVEEMKCGHGSCYCGQFQDGNFHATHEKFVPTKLLDDVHKKYMFKSGEQEKHPGNKYPYYYPSSGIAAIAYTVIERSPSDIYLIGFDFHEGGYASGQTMTAPGNERLGQKEMLNKLIKLFPNTHFHLYTLSDFAYSHSNLTYHKVLKQNSPIVKHKKLAVVLGGWHYPYLYYRQLKEQVIPAGWEIEFYVVSHRDPELPIVFDEKQPLLKDRGIGTLQTMDNNLYSRIITKQELSELGFIYNEEESAIGDLYQLNQWVQRHYTGQYDKVLFTHDDNYLLTDQLFIDILENKADLFINKEKNDIVRVSSNLEWKHLASGVLENTTTPRTSFTFMDKEFLDKLAPDLEAITTEGVDLDRTGATDTLYDLNDKQVSTKALYSWNAPSRNFTRWIKENGFADTSVRLSPVYRVTKYFIEGERGFIWTQRDENRIMNNLKLYYNVE